MGPAVGSLVFRELQAGHRSGHSPCGGHPVNWRIDARGEENHAVLTPSATAGNRSVTNGDGWTSYRFDSLELSSRKKTDRLAIRRPEGKERTLSARQRLSLQGIQRTDPQQKLIVSAIPGHINQGCEEKTASVSCSPHLPGPPWSRRFWDSCT